MFNCQEVNGTQSTVNGTVNQWRHRKGNKNTAFEVFQMLSSTNWGKIEGEAWNVGKYSNNFHSKPL